MNNFTISTTKMVQLTSYWMSFVDMVEMLLGLIWASMEGNWLLHLSAIMSMIPWCFAYSFAHSQR